MSKAKRIATLPLTVLVMALFTASIVLQDQAVYSQLDYEEYLIVEDTDTQKIKTKSGSVPETKTDQNIFQKNIGSGSSTNINCAQNLIDGNSDLDCSERTPPVPPTPTDCTDFVSDTIPVGDIPVGIIYNSFNDRIYVANFGGGTISVIDPSTNEVVDSIEIGTTLINLAFNPSNGIIYSANLGEDTVSVISGTTNDVIDTIAVPNPYGIAVHPPTGKVYVTDDRSAVIVIDPGTNTISNTIEVPIGPISAGFNSINGLMYVASSGNDPTDVVSVINPLTDEVIDTIPVGDSPQGIAFNPHNGNIYITNGGTSGNLGNTVSVIDPVTNEVIDTIEVTGFVPVGIAFNSFNDRIYVAVSGTAPEPGNHVSVIDANTNEEIDTVEVGLNPFFVAFNPNNGKIYVTNSGSDTVSVISCTSNP